ncbi:MAG: hypothetical protein ACYC9S_08070 [Leptospirales bacterium]
MIVPKACLPVSRDFSQLFLTAHFSVRFRILYFMDFNLLLIVAIFKKKPSEKTILEIESKLKKGKTERADNFELAQGEHGSG